jgi:hypothetical protein
MLVQPENRRDGRVRLLDTSRVPLKPTLRQNEGRLLGEYVCLRPEV